MANQEIEKIEKTDDLSKWRTKINKVFSMIKNSIPSAPKNRKSFLVSDGENISWQEFPKSSSDSNKSSETNENQTVSGILTTEHIIVNNVAVFRGNIEIAEQAIASSLLLKNNSVIDFAYGNKHITIKPSSNGLKINNIVISNDEIILNGLYFKHCHITTTDTSLVFTGNDTITPFSVNFNDNIVRCAAGIMSPKYYFDKNNFITVTEYSGNSKSADKLKSSVKVFGNAFDGTKNIIGTISDCTGIKFICGITSFEFPSTKDLPNILQEKNGVMTYTGEFIPKKFNVKSEHYAEYYPSKVRLEKGDVISFDFSSNTETYIKVNKKDGHPLGVVTDDFAMIIGEKTTNSYPVCNKGRVYAKVIGTVEQGDNLCVSSNDGMLRKLQPKEKLTETWAIALENSNDENEKLIKIHII